ncbi:MAG: ABC transporter permease [Lachnospiraceae bacterium]|nr:ABC transporter permease [Lachnospiraceae bacterium]
MSEKRERFIRICITAATILCVFVLWFLATSLGWVNTRLVPSPGAVWNAFIEILTGGYKNNTLLAHLGASLGRLLIAFCGATLLGVPLGMLSGFHPRLGAVFEPLVEFFRPLPPLAYYVLLVLWLGLGNESKIVLLLFACLPPIFVACAAATKRVPADYKNSARALGASQRQLFLHIVFFYCLPDTLTGMRTAFGVGYTTLVSAEMVAALSGIGWMVLDAQRNMRNDVIFVGIFIMGLTGILIDFLLRRVEKRLVPWAGKA